MSVVYLGFLELTKSLRAARSLFNKEGPRLSMSRGPQLSQTAPVATRIFNKTKFDLLAAVEIHWSPYI